MKKSITQCLSIIISMGIFISSLTGCSTKNNSISDYGYYFDTIISIELFGTNDHTLLETCFEIAKDCENLFSNTIESSDISLINSHPGEYITCDERTVELISTAIAYGDSSNGKFDITLGKLSELWNISDIAKNADDANNNVSADYIPSDIQIGELKNSIDYKKIHIQNNQIMLEDDCCKIDVGGIAKGYVADLIKMYLIKEGITSACINLGGNILTLGNKPNGNNYNIGIQKPFGKRNETIATLSINDKSVVSSGVYERYYRVNDEIYHHILDIHSGYPVNNNLYEVTIISDSSIDGDALSTITFMLGLEDGLKFIETIDNTEAIFITDNYEMYYTSGAKIYIK